MSDCHVDLHTCYRLFASKRLTKGVGGGVWGGGVWGCVWGSQAPQEPPNYALDKIEIAMATRTTTTGLNSACSHIYFFKNI